MGDESVERQLPEDSDFGFEDCIAGSHTWWLS